MEAEDIKELKDAGVVKELTDAAPPEVLAEAQTCEVGGGAGECAATVEISTQGVRVNTSVGNVGCALTATYEGVVDATSHVIERVARAIKPQ